MKLLQIQIPKWKVADIHRCLDSEGLMEGEYTTLRGEQHALIQVRCSLKRAIRLLAVLDARGVGSKYGVVNILTLDATKPEIEDNKFHFSHRLTTEEILNNVQRGGTVSFDYVALLVIAAVISGVGLATNNSPTIVASMLVSPLMGPIVAFTFGTIIRNKDLVLRGLKLEMYSLIGTVVLGFLIAIPFSPFATELGWPNSQMESRGVAITLLFGIAIAAPSGAGVALSITGANASSLVGVAISVSLLPPAVNAGINLCYAFLGRYMVHNLDYEKHLQMAGISFCLTLVNIICIYIFAIMMFWIKKVAPATPFWDTEVPLSEVVTMGTNDPLAASPSSPPPAGHNECSPPPSPETAASPLSADVQGNTTTNDIQRT